MVNWLKVNGDNILRLNYPLNENSIVFDVGGYHGDWASKIIQKYNSIVYIFEPINEFVDIIKKNIQNDSVTILDYGLSDETKTIEISVNDDSSSVFKTTNNMRLINLKSIKEFLDENKSINEIDLIKINIEGGEYQLLESLINESLITRFKNIQIQFHTCIDNAVERREKIRLALAKTHKETYNFDWIWENWELKLIL